MTSKQQVPQLRFPEFKDEWEEKKLGDLGEFLKTYSFSRAIEGKGKYKHIHYGDIHSNLPLIIQNSEILPMITEKQDFVTVKKNDLIIADASEDYKDLGKSVLVNFDDNNVIAGLHTYLFRANELVNSKFLSYFTKTISYYKYILRNGTGISVLGISKNNLKKLKFYIPSFIEQQKIGDFFSKLDRQIELEEQKLELLEQQKKGYMQKIFSQELRFKDENGNDYPEWEKKKLGDVFSILDGDRGKNYPKSEDFSEYGHTLFLSAANVTKKGFSFDQKQYITKEKSILMGNGKLEKNDVVITTRGTLGNVGRYSDKIFKNYPFVRINSGMIIIRTGNHEKALFLSQFLNSMKGKKQINFISFGSAQPQLTKKDIKLFEIPSLESEEQQKIGDFFSKFDQLIDLQSKKIEKLNQRKQAFLQQMFV